LLRWLSLRPCILDLNLVSSRVWQKWFELSIFGHFQ